MEQYADSFTLLGQFQRLRLINPRVLLAFVEIEAKCWDHFNLLFTVTPRYEIDSTWSSSVPQNVYLLFGDFVPLRCIEFYLSRGWTPFARIPYKSASSAENFTSKCSPFGKPFTYVKKSRGSKNVPCGTQEATGETLYAPPSQITVWWRPVIKDSNQVSRVPWIP